MRFGIRVSVPLSAYAHAGVGRRCHRNSGAMRVPSMKTGATNAAALFREDAAREMDERLARHERAGRRATSGICDGCIPGARSHHRVKPREMVGEDGLAFRAEDLR